jgi:hypothetical protein
VIRVLGITEERYDILERAYQKAEKEKKDKEEAEKSSKKGKKPRKAKTKTKGKGKGKGKGKEKEKEVSGSVGREGPQAASSSLPPIKKVRLLLREEGNAAGEASGSRDVVQELTRVQSPLRESPGTGLDAGTAGNMARELTRVQSPLRESPGTGLDAGTAGDMVEEDSGNRDPDSQMEEEAGQRSDIDQNLGNPENGVFDMLKARLGEC